MPLGACMAGLAGQPYPGGHGHGTKVAPRRAASASPRRVNVQVLCDGPRHGGVSHTPFASDSPGALTLGDALASDTPLQLRQLGLAAQMHPTPADEQEGVFDYGRFECDSGLAYRSVCLFGQIRIVDDKKVKQRFFQALMAKYGKPETKRPEGFFPRIDIITLYAIEVERMTGRAAHCAHGQRELFLGL
jgi:hypothetical protein